MGNDGGSIPRAFEQRKTKKLEIPLVTSETLRAKWFNCALTKEPLEAPIVCDHVGLLYNKTAIIRALMEKRMPIHMGHLRSLKVLLFPSAPRPRPRPHRMFLIIFINLILFFKSSFLLDSLAALSFFSLFFASLIRFSFF